MDELKNFTLPQLYTKLNLSDDKFKAWFVQIGLLHARRTCIFGSDMRLEKDKPMEVGFVGRGKTSNRFILKKVF